MTPSAPDAPTGGPDQVAGRWRVESPGVGNPVMERLQEVGALTRVIEKRLSGALGVNATGLSAMEHLAGEGPLTAKDLADRLRVSTAASTHIVDRLEQAGHVVRRPHATDRRKVLVEPVQGSMTRLFDHLNPLLRGVESLVEALSPDDRDAVENFLTEVVRIYTDTADSLPQD
ncbi:MarR family winged helix-turn-helix transcriptional regulator [Actinokineospora auranticolor]|uniref:DNA-binding MarR family transcriptional regulator n=1 Tax=Actinokineospora auranticolor TaxID=155976 RepID=A0A2S6GIP7_9PSEU|nr:MarR family winged helix-turn-helix transcriptional regulator [Actinokineospora auranticolor]PPK65089.1 DNA-binding MarR family transcriptional regulator [Actinokineospora auranticolor]